MTLLGIALAAAAATFVGGFFALKFHDKLHLVLGFSAGAVAGVALFDLLPEAIDLGTKYYDTGTIVLFIALGFFGYLILDRLILLHTHEGAGESAPRGFLGALTLSTHSFFDGMAIGVAFQVSVAVGSIVTVAVLAHDFSDGINTVNMILHNGGSPDAAGRGADWERRLWRRAFGWLLVDAVAPALGIISTLFFRIPESALGLVLAVFVGTFLYLSASDLIPESHHRHPRALTTLMTLLGALALYTIIQLV